jgi:hypothetical protein
MLIELFLLYLRKKLLSKVKAGVYVQKRPRLFSAVRLARPDCNGRALHFSHYPDEL